MKNRLIITLPVCNDIWEARHDMPNMQRNDDPRQRVGDAMPARVQRQLPVDCPNCGHAITWHATKYAAGQQGLCTNCGYSLTVTDDIKRGG